MHKQNNLISNATSCHMKSNRQRSPFYVAYQTFSFLFMLLFLGYGFTASSAPVEEIRNAQQLMEKGSPQEALDALKELQVDHPESPEVRFGIGCAWFMLAETAAAAGNMEEAKKDYQEARNAFDALLHDENVSIAREATYNRANCTLREAATVDTAQQYADAVAALRRAVEAYEAGVKQYPDHEGMRTNLAHARFQLNQLLQNPPP